MIPHFQTQRKLPCLPCLPRFSPSSTSTSAVRTSSAVRKWKQTMRRRWERGWEFVLCHDKKKKYTARESNMSSRHSDSVLCPLAFYMSQTIFKNHQTRSHFHWRVSNRPQRCAATIIEFLCLGICTDEMWFPTLHSRCQKSLCVPLPFNWLIFPSFYLCAARTSIHLRVTVTAAFYLFIYFLGVGGGFQQETVKRAKEANVWTGELEKEKGNKEKLPLWSP